MSQAHLYSHPDGEGFIVYDIQEKRLYVTNEVMCMGASILIGPDGLRELADELLAVAAAMEVEQ